MSDRPATRNPAVLALLTGVWTSTFRPRQSVADWCQAQRVPMVENRTYRGQPYDWSRGPFLSALIFGFFDERHSRELILMKDSQSMATSMTIFSMAWMLVNNPGNVIYITNTRDKVREFSRDRIEPVFKAIKGLGVGQEEAIDTHSKIKNSRVRRGQESTAMAWRFPGGVLYLGGGQSTASLVGTPAAWVLLDEISKHPFVNEMTTIDLARSRVTGDDESKIFAFSTPENEVEYVREPATGIEKPAVMPESVSHLEFLTGTQEHCEVMCPHCRHWQELVFERLVFGHCKEVGEDGKRHWNLDRVLNETWYRCENPECSDRNEDGTARGRIDEHSKRWMAMPGNFRWTPRNMSPEPGRRSATISALYNIANQARRWGKIALAFLDATRKGGQAALKSFYTDFLGTPFKPYRVSGTALEQVRKLRGPWRRKVWREGQQIFNPVLPFDANEMKFVGLRADVQSGYLKWQISAFAKDGRMHILDWGQSPELEDLPDLVKARMWTTRPIEGDTPDEYEIGIVFVDTGHQTKLVYQFLARMASESTGCIWEGIRGMSRENSAEARLNSWWIREYPVTGPGGVELPGLRVTVNNIDSSYWEEELYLERIHRHNPEKPREEHPAVILPFDVDDMFMQELCNMKQAMKKTKGGRFELVWEKIRRDANDQGDVAKYGLVQWHSVVQREYGGSFDAAA